MNTTFRSMQAGAAAFTIEDLHVQFLSRFSFSRQDGQMIFKRWIISLNEQFTPLTRGTDPLQ